MRKIAVILIILISTIAPATVLAQSGSLSGPSSAAEGQSVTLQWCAYDGDNAVIDVSDGGVSPSIPIGMGCGSVSVTPSENDGDGNGIATYRVQVDGDTVTPDVNITIGGSGGWAIPDFPSPTEIIKEILDYIIPFLLQPVISTLGGWLSVLLGGLTTFLRDNLELDGSGLVGTLANDGFTVTRTLAASLISISFLLTLVQQIMNAALPGVFKYLTLEQVLGRLLIVVPLCLPQNSFLVFISVNHTIENWTWHTLLGYGDPMGWADLIITPLMAMINGTMPMTMIIIWTIAIMLLFVSCMVMMFLIKFILLIVVVILPIAGVCWLFPFSEELWGKYWWLAFKATVAPLLMALLLRLHLALMNIVTSGGIMGVLVMLVVGFAALSLFLKFLLAAAPVAVGAALTASGNPVAGLPMLARSIGNMTGQREAGYEMSRTITLSRKLFPKKKDEDGD